MRIRSAVLAAALFAAGPALAQEPVATAQPSVAEQIDAYLKSSPVREIPADGVDGVVPGETERDRKVHGEVSVGIGTHGYRSVYMRADAPLGRNGNVSVAFEDTRGRFGGYGHYDCDLDGLVPSRPHDGLAGPYDRCAGQRRR